MVHPVINLEWLLAHPELVLTIVIGIVGLIVQWRLKAVFGKYAKVPFQGGMTGREVAEKMLRDNNIHDVQVISIHGRLTDNFNPTNKTINLSEGVYDGNSVSAAAVAAHETGHAIQHAREYAPLKMRSALVPAISFASTWSMWVIIAGVMLINTFPALFWIGILMIALSALFALITLPVEYNASRHAMEWLQESRTLEGEQLGQARIALNWAARTYLIAALAAIATLLYYLSFARRN